MRTKGGKKYYAVRVGREGPNVYETWDECEKNVTQFHGAIHRSFSSRPQAEAWVEIGKPRSSLSLLSKNFAIQPPTAVRTSKESQQIIRKKPDDAEMVIDAFEGEPDYIKLPSSPDPGQSAAVPAEDIVLSPTQEEVLQKVKRGENVFFTGSAGTGKSVLLRKIIEELGGVVSCTLAITASTGIAAVNIGGTTLHSFAGVGLAKESKDKLAGKVFGQKSLRHVLQRWRECRTLIIDEVSMIDGTFFDKLEYLARRFRDNHKPFGGIQLVMSGDFCQLPPVPDQHKGTQIPITFAFDAATWNSCVGPPIILSVVFRQKEKAFVNMLNAMRFGNLDRQSIMEFKKLQRPVTYNDGIAPTELFPLRRDVEQANNSRLALLPGAAQMYISLDTPGRDTDGKQLTPAQTKTLLERLVAVAEVSLKVGAQVMLIKNLVQGHLVNGSVGKVIEFRSLADAIESRTAIAQVDSRNPGQLHVPSAAAEQQCDGKSLKNQPERVWPLVQFANGREVLCVPQEFTVVNVHGEVEAKREQIPLILAWALSIHKSQGQTLERVKVNLGNIFEKGQAYVALSRATRMDTLEVLNFDARKVMAHERVIEWQAEMERKREEEEAFLRDMDNEEAMMSYHGL